MRDKLQTQNAKRKTVTEAGGAFARMLFCVLSFAFCIFFLAGCFDRKMDAVINPDGSGKMLIETDVAVPALGGAGEEKISAVEFGRLFAADLVNSAPGMDAWSDLSISEAADGRAHVAIVGYFKDINALRFKAPQDLPLKFTWELHGQEGTLGIERIHQEKTDKLSPADAAQMVKDAQADYKVKQMAMHTQLSALTLKITFELPGEITEAQVLERDKQDKGKATLTLDGKKIAAALDAFMANDKALQAMFEKGEDTSANDDLMLMSMLNQTGPVSATVAINTADGPKGAELKPAFDYKTQMRTAELHQQEMFEQAGVELIPKFIVKPAATKPAR